MKCKAGVREWRGVNSGLGACEDANCKQDLHEHEKPCCVVGQNCGAGPVHVGACKNEERAEYSGDDVCTAMSARSSERPNKSERPEAPQRSKRGVAGAHEASEERRDKVIAWCGCAQIVVHWCIGPGANESANGLFVIEHRIKGGAFGGDADRDERSEHQRCEDNRDEGCVDGCSSRHVGRA